MKRFISLLVACIIALSCSIAYAVDYSSMTDTELEEQLDAIHKELLARRIHTEDKTILLDQSGVQIYLTGSAWIDNGLGWLKISIAIINNSGRDIFLYIKDASVNGWIVPDASLWSSYCGYNIPNGNKLKDELRFPLYTVDGIDTIQDFEEAEFILYTNGNNSLGTQAIPYTKCIIYASQIE